MVLLKPKDWARVVQICNVEAVLSRSEVWPLKQLWSSLLRGELFSDTSRKVQSVLSLRETPDTYEIDYLITDRLARGEGVMTGNFKHLKEKAHSLSKSIWLEVSEINVSACAFYEKNGFRLQRVRKNYYKNSENARIYSYFPHFDRL